MSTTNDRPDPSHQPQILRLSIIGAPRLSIIGAGRVGSALGPRWSEGGHTVVYGVRDPSEPRHQTLPGTAATPADASRDADVVVIALPWAAVEDTLTGLEVGTAVIVDATNPLAANARELTAHPELSGAELIAGWTGSSRVIKAFNTTGAGNMANPAYPASTSVRALMPVAGDDAAAKQTVIELATELGFDAIDAGGLSAARDLEHLAMLWIRMAYTLGNGPDIAFALLRR